MSKNKIGANTYLYPMPVTIVGANVNGKANFVTVAYCGIVQHKPPMISVTLSKSHYTNLGIKENNTFSVNIPSRDMVSVTDYIGLNSGRDIDKSKLFKIFYGKLKTAPLIEEAPLNLECKLIQCLDYGGSGEIFMGEIVEVYIEEGMLTEGLPDIEKIKPFIFSMHDGNYWEVGKRIAKAWDIGKIYKR
ncbi:MAG: flavin reductase family protein [Candidatus Omnitrophica bacterium]|nr:flavin reductase family protein [Candidatus Omnitrophota bacterium]